MAEENVVLGIHGAIDMKTGDAIMSRCCDNVRFEFADVSRRVLPFSLVRKR